MSNSNTFTAEFPSMPERFINSAKVVAIFKSDNGQDASEIYVDSHIDIWEKVGSGYKLTVYINPDYPSDMQAYIDVKVYFYNTKDYYGF